MGWTISAKSGIINFDKKRKSIEEEKYTGYKPERKKATGCKPSRPKPVEVRL